MICNKCHSNIPDSANFCNSCGNQANNFICNSCNTLNLSTAKYCEHCGTLLFVNPKSGMRRVFAFYIDVIFIGCILYALITQLIAFPHLIFTKNIINLLYFSRIYLLPLIFAYYFIFELILDKGSIGKYYIGLRVCSAKGNSIDIIRFFVRTFARYLEFLFVIYFPLILNFITYKYLFLDFPLFFYEFITLILLSLLIVTCPITFHDYLSNSRVISNEPEV